MDDKQNLTPDGHDMEATWLFKGRKQNVRAMMPNGQQVEAGDKFRPSDWNLAPSRLDHMIRQRSVVASEGEPTRVPATNEFAAAAAKATGDEGAGDAGGSGLHAPAPFGPDDGEEAGDDDMAKKDDAEQPAKADRMIHDTGRKKGGRGKG